MSNRLDRLAVADAIRDNPAAEGCSGVGRPSCTATECMYGLAADLTPKAFACAFLDRTPAAEAPARPHPADPLPSWLKGRCWKCGDAENTISHQACYSGDDLWHPFIPLPFEAAVVRPHPDLQTPICPKEGDKRTCPLCSDKHQQVFTSKHGWVHENNTWALAAAQASELVSDPQREAPKA